MSVRFAFAGLGLLVAVSACSSSNDTGTTPSPSGNLATPAVVLVRGVLAGDVPSSKAKHDGIVGNAKKQANDLGDVGHYTFLGAQDQTQFLAIDRWTNLDGLNKFFNDKDVGAAFVTLYKAKPSVTPYEPAAGWVTWGDIDYRAHGNVVAVTIHAHLASADQAASQKLHDDAAGPTKDKAIGLGDVGHAALLGIADPRDFVAVDYWTDPNGPTTFYSNADLLAAFGKLFDTKPEITIQASSDWAQW